MVKTKKEIVWKKGINNCAIWVRNIPLSILNKVWYLYKKLMFEFLSYWSSLNMLEPTHYLGRSSNRNNCFFNLFCSSPAAIHHLVVTLADD